MRHTVTVHQLATTGEGAFLNVRDLVPYGVSGFDVWGSSLNPETTDTNVAALALDYTGDDGVVFHLVIVDTLKDFTRWLDTDGQRYSTVYLITPSGLQLVKPHATVPTPIGPARLEVMP